MIRVLLRYFLVTLGCIPRPDLIGRTNEEHPSPEALLPGLLIVVRGGEHAKWACFRCPCGCGQKIQLSLNPHSRPRWTIQLDYLCRPSVEPSVRQLTGCRSHFWIKHGHVEWCDDSGE
jgi:hypothetical protein